MIDFSGGYYTIELANRRLRLVALNTNLYLTPPNEVAAQERHQFMSDLDLERSWTWLEETLTLAERKRQNVRGIMFFFYLYCLYYL